MNEHATGDTIIMATPLCLRQAAEHTTKKLSCTPDQTIRLVTREPLSLMRSHEMRAKMSAKRMEVFVLLPAKIILVTALIAKMAGSGTPFVCRVTLGMPLRLADFGAPP